MAAIGLLTRVALLVSLTSVPAFAQSTPPPPPPLPATPPATTPPAAQQQEPATDPADLPVDLDRIKKRLENPSRINLDKSSVKFYVEVVAKQYTFKDYLGSRNLNDGGPIANSQMTHQEFLDMVNPKLLNSSAGFTATDTLQVALFNWAVGKAVKKGVAALRNARDEAEVRAIRAQIDREIAALRGGGE